MPHKYPDYIFLFFHGSKHTAIQRRSTGFFHPGTNQHGFLIAGRLIVFRQRDVEKSQRGQRPSPVSFGILPAVVAVPRYLVRF